MSKFRINPIQIDCCADGLNRISNSIEIISQELEHINLNRFLSSSSAWKLDTSLQRVSSNIEILKVRTGGCADALRKISSCYKNTEKMMMDSKKGNSQAGTGSGSNGSSGAVPSGKSSEQNDSKPKSASFISGSVEESVKIAGLGVGYEVSGEFLGGSWEHKFTSGIEKKDGKTDISLFDAEIGGEVHVAKGKVKGNVGYMYGEAEAIVGQVKGKGSAGATLFKDGQLAPQLSLLGELSGAAISGKATAKFGSDNTDIHASAEGSLLSGDLKGELGIGKVTYEEKDGSVHTGYGVSAEAKAEGYLAQGRVKGGFKIFGIDVEVGMSGKAGGAGASIGGHFVNGSVGGSIGAGLGLGLGLDFNIDWTDFKWGW